MVRKTSLVVLLLFFLSINEIVSGQITPPSLPPSVTLGASPSLPVTTAPSTTIPSTTALPTILPINTALSIATPSSIVASPPPTLSSSVISSITTSTQLRDTQPISSSPDALSTSTILFNSQQQKDFKEIVKSGSRKCGQVEFDSFNVWYSKKKNRIAFNATGKSSLSLSDRQARLFVYFDPSHVLFVDKPICSSVNDEASSGDCVLGETTDTNFRLTSVVDTRFKDTLPDIIFKVPGTGSFAILTLTPPNNSENATGCVYASIGNPHVVKSNIVSGISAGIAIISALLIIVAKWRNSNSWQTRGEKEKKNINQQQQLQQQLLPENYQSQQNPDHRFSLDEYNNPQNPVAFWSAYRPHTMHNGIASSIATSQIPLKLSRTSTPTNTNKNLKSIQAPSLEDFIGIAQWIVITGLLALPNLPIGYRQFTSNFGWLFGIVSSTFFSRLRARACPLLLSNCLAFSNDPSSNDSNKNCTLEESLALNSDMRPPENLFATNNITKTTTNTSTHLNGILSYASVSDIPASNFFFTVLMIFSIAIALVILLVGFMGAIAHFYKRWKDIGRNVHLYVPAAVLQVVLLLYQPITLFAVYQLTIQHECLLLRLLAISVIGIFSLGAIIFCSYKIIHAYITTPTKLWETNEYRIIYAKLYNHYRENRILFFLSHVAIISLRPLMVGVIHSSIGQLIGMGILECAYMLLLIFYRPFYRKSTNRMNIGLASVRFVTVIMLIPFIGEGNMVSSATRISLTIALIMLQGLTIGLIALLILIHAGIFIRKYIKTSCNVKVANIDNIDAEKKMELYAENAFTNASNDSDDYTCVDLDDNTCNTNIKQHSDSDNRKRSVSSSSSTRI
ncbi:5682_t:CDS:2 [Ambispora gerdemannii]|uniref:5682_t:CDS:1 n=1 Tax=Ambispora gerdemannii TaxID=144530 RepID=A0A9N8WS99_9GLOM|nr:5682_t:CDS:2 [Ambispora gerdemannii]